VTAPGPPRDADGRGVGPARLLRWLATGVALVVVALWLREVDWSEAWRVMRRASPAALLLATAVNLTTVVAKGARWWVFLRATCDCPLSVAIRGAIVGSGLNNILPANGGEGARALLVSRRAAISSATVLASIAVDRATDVATFALLLLVVPLAGALPLPLRRLAQEVELALLAAGLAAAAMVALARHRRRTRARAPGDRPRWRRWLSRFVHGVSELPTPRRVAAATALSLVAWVAQIVAYHLTARAVGLTPPVLASAAAVAAVNIAFLVQVTPGNVGVVQVVYALAMGAFGVAHDAAVGVAVLLQALQILPVTALALLLAPTLAVRRRAA
jgi:uncharacterized protein (TIRG00374 family)